MAGGVTINGRDLSLYGAKMLDFSVSGISYTDNYSMQPNGFFPVRYQGQASLRDLTLTLDFVGTTWAECETLASDFMAELASGADIGLPDGYLYFCVIQKNAAPKRPSKYITTHTINLKAVRHGALETATTTTTETLLNAGNRPAPARVTVSGITGTVTVFGVTITGLTGTVILDGLSKTVTQNGQNVFGNTNLVKFPLLDVGYNEITVPSGCTVKVEYYPLYA